MASMIFGCLSLFFTGVLFFFSIPVLVITIRLKPYMSHLTLWPYVVWGASCFLSAGSRLLEMTTQLNMISYSWFSWCPPIMGCLIGICAILFPFLLKRIYITAEDTKEQQK